MDGGPRAEGPEPDMPEPAGPEPLAPEDLAILELEGPTVAGHTCKVVKVAGPGLDVERVTALVSERVASVPQLTRRLGEAGGAPAWVPDPEFDPALHVADAGAADERELRRKVAELFEQRLDRELPLWRIDTVSLDDGSLALVWRIHHALADGTTAMRFAKALLWDEDPQGEAARARAVHAADQERRRAHLAAFYRRELGRSRMRSPFDGRIGSRRAIAFAEVPLPDLHDAAKRSCGATLNDAVLSLVAGALRRWLEAHHAELGEVRVKVPVSLHHAGEDAGNRDSFFSVPLPLGEPDPHRRLSRIHEETLVRKEDRDAQHMDELIRRLARVSPRLERVYERIESSPRRFAVNVSNVPGPRRPVSVLGGPVTSLHSIAEIGEHHALRIAVVSVADTLCFGFCADPEIVRDLDAMAEGVVAEAEALVAG